jgi:peptidoglycan/LPS O-acetylase OafA/YrhL
MVTRWWNWAILALGVVILLLSILADAIWLGRFEGFGWKQTVGVVVGIVLIAVGYYRHGRPV